MELVLLIARLILAVVFGVAGVSKLADREGSRKALAGFGVAESVAAPLVWLLPAAELLVAIALLPLSTAWLGAVGALGLLLVFLAVIGVNLARGNAPDCHCFGQLHSEPVSWPVFGRNVGLAAVAAFVVVLGKDNPGLSALSWMGESSAGEMVSLVFSVFAAAMLIPTLVMLRRTLRQQATLLESVTAMRKLIEEDYAEPEALEREDALPPAEGLPVGAMAPTFSLPALDGGEVSLNDLLALGKSVLLLFVSPTCSPCKTLLPHIRAWQRDYGDLLTIALLSQGAEKDVRSKISKYEARHLLLLGDSSVTEDYQATWTPAALLIAPDGPGGPGGRIASAVTSGDEAIRALVTHTVATSELPAVAWNHQNGVRPQIKLGGSLFKVGEPAPRFSLPDLQGKEVDLAGLLGRETLLLFWNPGCGYCQAMAEDLKRWEARPAREATRIVFVSTGEAAEVRKESRRFESLVLHDPDDDAAPLFGANGTPSAVLLDAEGRIASSLAVGERNILALLGVRKVELPIANLAVNGARALESVSETA